MVTSRTAIFRSVLLSAAILGSSMVVQAQQQPPQPGMMGHGNMPMMGQGMGQMPMMGFGMGNMPMTGQGMGQMPMMGYGMGNMPMMGGDINTYTDTRATFLKSQLGLTEAQTPAWTTYISAFRAHLTAKQQHHQTMMTSMTAGTTSAQSAEAIVSSMDGCHKAMKDLKNAYVALYQALNPEQKQKADAVFSGMGWMM